MYENIAEVSEVDHSSKAKSCNIRYYLLPIDTVLVMVLLSSTCTTTCTRAAEVPNVIRGLP